MKKKPTVLIILFCICAIANGSVYEIDKLSKASVYAYIDEGWEPGATCIKAQILTTKDIDGKKVKLVAYFYNKDHELVYKLKKPTSVSLASGKSYRSPVSYEKNNKYEVYFGISNTIRNGDKKWKYAVIVFGTAGDYVAEVFPSRGELMDFEFEEKSEIQAHD